MKKIIYCILFASCTNNVKPKEVVIEKPSNYEEAKRNADSVFFYMNQVAGKKISNEEFELKARPFQNQLTAYAALLNDDERKQLDQYRQNVLDSIIKGNSKFGN